MYRHGRLAFLEWVALDERYLVERGERLQTFPLLVNGALDLSAMSPFSTRPRRSCTDRPGQFASCEPLAERGT